MLIIDAWYACLLQSCAECIVWWQPAMIKHTDVVHRRIRVYTPPVYDIHMIKTLALHTCEVSELVNY